MADGPGRGIDAARVLDVKGANAFGVDQGGQMAGVARVVPADHDHHIQGLVDQLEDRVLPFLRRRADRVEGAEMIGKGGASVAALHAFAELLRDGERFAGEHRRLIRDADLPQVGDEVETRGGRARELLQRRGVGAAFDEVTHGPGLRHVEHD